MSDPISLHLPNSLHRQLKEYAEQDGVSIDQFIATAVAEKLASLATKGYLEERARRGDRDTFKAILDKVPNVEPDEADSL